MLRVGQRSSKVDNCNNLPWPGPQLLLAVKRAVDEVVKGDSIFELMVNSLPYLDIILMNPDFKNILKKRQIETSVLHRRDLLRVAPFCKLGIASNEWIPFAMTSKQHRRQYRFLVFGAIGQFILHTLEYGIQRH